MIVSARLRPTAYARDQPKIVSACAFHSMMLPSLSALTMASKALSTISRVRSSCARNASPAAARRSRDVAAARLAQEEIMTAVSRTIESSRRARRTQVGRPSFSRGQIIARVLALFEASAGAPPSTGDLSRATGVAERTTAQHLPRIFWRRANTIPESASAPTNQRGATHCRTDRRYRDRHCHTLRHLGFQLVCTQLQSPVRRITLR